MTALEFVLVYLVSESEPGSKEYSRALTESTDLADFGKGACAHFGTTAVDVVVKNDVCQPLAEVLLKLQKRRTGAISSLPQEFDLDSDSVSVRFEIRFDAYSRHGDDISPSGTLMAPNTIARQPAGCSNSGPTGSRKSNKTQTLYWHKMVSKCVMLYWPRTEDGHRYVLVRFGASAVSNRPQSYRPQTTLKLHTPHCTGVSHLCSARGKLPPQAVQGCKAAHSADHNGGLRSQAGVVPSRRGHQRHSEQDQQVHQASTFVSHLCSSCTMCCFSLSTAHLHDYCKLQRLGRVILLTVLMSQGCAKQQGSHQG